MPTQNNITVDYLDSLGLWRVRTQNNHITDYLDGLGLLRG